MSSAAALTVTLDPASGTAELRGAVWSMRCPIGDLPRWQALYRALWSRGAKHKDAPGPWARFYGDALQVLDQAIRDARARGLLT